MRGIVFWAGEQLILLKEDLTWREISDYENIYATLEGKGSVVEIQEFNEIVALQDIFSMTFYEKGNECPANEALRATMLEEPELLIEAMYQDENET